MRRVATINGVEIHSDKEIRSVTNSRVTFADGSWCDATTGEVINKGSGTITLGNRGSSNNEPVITKTQSYVATELIVQGLCAHRVVIRPSDRRDILVELTGSAAQVESVSAKINNGMLRLSGGTAGGSSRQNISIVRKTLNVVFSKVTVTSGSDTSGLVVTVDVPLMTPLVIWRNECKVQIGDTGGSLVAEADSVWGIEAGKVGTAKLATRGTADIKVAEVIGDLTMVIVGVGAINVKGGEVGHLDICDDGVGSATFNGTAQTANLKALSVGSIKVHKVMGRVDRTLAGVGSINVGNK